MSVAAFSPSTPGTPAYDAIINSARSYLRRRDFLTYSTPLVPEQVGSETWSVSWGYIRHFDDMIDSPKITKEQAIDLMEQEREIVEVGLAGNLKLPRNAPLRHHWLAQFFYNERKFYSGRALQVIKDLYESAWGDVQRRGQVLTEKEMSVLLYKKARSFFKLYFILADFDLQGHLDDFSYLLGMGLGMLDDILDLAIDYNAGYVNITQEEMRNLGIELQPGDEGFLEHVIKRGYLTYKAKKIMSLLIKARALARRIRVPLVKTFLLRLTEIFASPIIEGRFIPGQQYIFKGGRLADKILPKNEALAYRIGHTLIKYFLKYPQVPSVLFKREYEE